jgi:hypothetical protein
MASAKQRLRIFLVPVGRQGDDMLGRDDQLSELAHDRLRILNAHVCLGVIGQRAAL